MKDYRSAIRRRLEDAPLPFARLYWLFRRAPEADQIVAHTYFPGCKLTIYRIAGEWHVKVTNRDPGKIPNEDIRRAFEGYLSHGVGDDVELTRGRHMNFRLQSVCLENWRDIWSGRIRELIRDDNKAFETPRVGAFGYLKGTTKPERLRFQSYAEEDPDRFEYIATDKYSATMRNGITLLEYKRRFKYVIDLPGHTYSTKIYWMMFLKRPVFYLRPKMKFAWEEQLKPWEHYIPVASDYSDLRKHYDWAETHPGKAAAISEALFDFGMHRLPPERVIGDFCDLVRSCCKPVPEARREKAVA